MVSERTEDVRLDPVFLGLRIIHGPLSRIESPAPFDHPLLPEKIGGLNGARLVGGAEDHSVAKVNGEDFGFVGPQGKSEGRGRLRGGNDCGAGLPDDVAAIVTAGSVLACGHEPLRFVSPQNQQVVLGPFLPGFVEPPEGVIVEQQFQKRVHVPAFGLEHLRHRHKQDASSIQNPKVERAPVGSKKSCSLPIVEAKQSTQPVSGRDCA